MDPRLHHPLPILTYMAQAHAPDGLPPPPPHMPAMTGVASTPVPDGGAVSDADLDKHMIAKGLARLPEPHSDADLELLWRTLSNEYPHRMPAGWQTHFAAHREEIMQILKIIVDNPSVSNAHYSFSEEELLVNFYAAGGPSSSSTSSLSWKSFAQENPSRTHDAWRMYGKRNRARLEGRILSRRQEFRDRGITILEESTIRPRPGNRAQGSDASAPDVGTISPRASTSAMGQCSPSGSLRRKTRRRPVTEDGVEDDGVDYSGDEDAYEATDDGNEPGASRKGKNKARRGAARGSLQGSTVDAAGGRGGKRRQSVSGSQVSRGSVVNDDEEPNRYVHSDARLTAESCIPRGQPDRRMKLMFTLDDRVALVQLLANSGPNPSPSDLLRFAARHKEHSLEDWLRLCDEEHEALLNEADLVRPMPPSGQLRLQPQSQPAQSAVRDEHIDPNIQDAPRQQENEQFQKQYAQHVQPPTHMIPISSPREADGIQEQMGEARFEDAPITVVSEQLAQSSRGAGGD